ncbi:MAG: sodium:solute symporter [Vicinamibacterales bacterium]
MSWVDWSIVGAYLVWVVWDGLRMSRNTAEVEGYFLAGRSLPWWAVGLSVMATQLSAITMTSTTGQGYADGMRFVQFYFGLPVAMIILSVTVVPFFWRARVYTAYEYLERRFDLKTRTLTAALFLISRGLSCSVIVAAPAVILSIVLGWNLTLTVLLIGVPTVIYTMIGGVQAVTWTDVKQMAVIVLGISAAVAVLIVNLPEGVSLGTALHIAGAAGKTKAIDFTFDVRQTYTFWSGLIGGLFLSLSYFGCDQSQVQRYLTARSVDEGRHSLYMSAFVKIPLQAMILLTGVLMFVYFLFHQGPMLFNAAPLAKIEASARADDYHALDAEYSGAYLVRKEAAAALAANDDEVSRAAFIRADGAVRDVRGRAVRLVKDVTGDAAWTDVNYVFPTFVTKHMPIGLIGLIIAAIFAAAMSSIAAELNSLATASVIDVYKRLIRPEASDRHYLSVSKWATAGWGLFACVMAMYAARLGSLIEVVNRYGSYFYGSLLGVFILALGVKRANGHGAFVGLVAGMAAVAYVATTWGVAYLWLNVVGAVVVTTVGLAVSLVSGPARVRD